MKNCLASLWSYSTWYNTLNTRDYISVSMTKIDTNLWNKTWINAIFKTFFRKGHNKDKSLILMNQNCFKEKSAWVAENWGVHTTYLLPLIGIWNYVSALISLSVPCNFALMIFGVFKNKTIIYVSLTMYCIEFVLIHSNQLLSKSHFNLIVFAC